MVTETVKASPNKMREYKEMIGNLAYSCVGETDLYIKMRLCGAFIGYARIGLNMLEPPYSVVKFKKYLDDIVNALLAAHNPEIEETIRDSIRKELLNEQIKINVIDAGAIEEISMLRDYQELGLCSLLLDGATKSLYGEDKANCEISLNAIIERVTEICMRRDWVTFSRTAFTIAAKPQSQPVIEVK